MANVDGVKIRPARIEDLAEPARWMQENHWNADKELLEMYLRVYGDKGIVAVDDSDRPIGFAQWCDINPSLGIGTRIIVRDDMRNRGIARQLVAASKTCLGDRNLMVNSVDAIAGLYKDKCGYKHEGYAIGIYNGIVNSEITLEPAIFDGSVIIGDSTHMDDVIAYDEAITGYQGYSRRRFLEENGNRDSDMFLIAKIGGNVCGYLTVRGVGDVFIVAPFMANTNAIANSLFNEMVRRLPVKPRIQLYVCEPAPDAIAHIIEQYQLNKVISGRALFTKTVVIPPGMDKMLSSAPF